MDIYDIIANEYEDIFPAEKAKIDCISSFITSNQSKIMDVGCATGQLIYEISHHNAGVVAVGIDVNRTMIDIARKKYSLIDNIRFSTHEMLTISDTDYYDIILCVGNTLPHLKNTDEIESFIGKIYTILEKDGIVILQYLNYDKILANGMVEFQDIETDSFTFRRRYSEITRQQVRFELDLYDKSSFETYSSYVYLKPVFDAEIDALLENAGFRHVAKFGNWDKKPAHADDFYRVVVAQK